MSILRYNCLAIRDPYLRSVRSKVVRVEGPSLLLDRTLFFPQLSAQPYDQGQLLFDDARRADVVEVHLRDDGIWHTLSGAQPAPGDFVTCQLDWPRRYFFMRSHTAAVLVSGLATTRWRCCVTCCDIREERIRLDLSCTKQPREDVLALLKTASRLCREGGPVVCATHRCALPRIRSPLVRSEMTKTRLDTGAVRVVRLGPKRNPIEEQYDIGTHVKDLREIHTIRPGVRGAGAASVSDNKGRAHFRIRFHLADYD